MNQSIVQYLNSGPQTEITLGVKKIAKSFTKDGINLIFEILSWLRKNLRTENSQEIKKKVFRRRTAQEIIESGFVTGCTDWTLAFIVLARAKGISTKYVETIKRQWLDEGRGDLIKGHVLAECFIDGRWYIIDTQERAIRIDYQRFIIFKKGLDSWNIGIKNFDELKEQFLEFKKKYRGKKFK